MDLHFNTNILILHDKVQALKKKLSFWKNNPLSGSYASFHCVLEFYVEN